MRFSIFHNLGAPGRLGEYARVMDEYTRTKSVWVNTSDEPVKDPFRMA